jgi:formate/nitrite transporter FocA (FNT family)
LTAPSCFTGIAADNPGLAKLLFAAVFPCGLYMTIMTGADLFTGNTMKMPAAFIEKKVTMNQLWKNWFWSNFGNFVDSLALVAMVACSGMLAGSALPIKMAVYKSSLTWGQVRLCPSVSSSQRRKALMRDCCGEVFETGESIGTV